MRINHYESWPFIDVITQDNYASDVNFLGWHFTDVRPDFKTLEPFICNHYTVAVFKIKWKQNGTIN